MRRVEGAARLWLWLWLLWGGDPGTCAGWRIYLSSWAVRVPAGAREAQRLARRHGLLYAGQVIEGNLYYHLRHRGIAPRSLVRHRGWHVRLKKEHQISWFEQQTVKKRVRRGLSVVPNDPWFPKQWYMNRDVLPDLNVFTAWSRGYTGSGVVVSILDDGIEKDHPDLTANYDPMASYDFNDNDPDPQPRYNAWDENRHGTRCAGEVAAAANYICGVGVAYRVKIGGVRMLDGTVTDIIEAQSLSFHSQHIDIYSASWGPEDDGKTVDGPGLLATAAFRQGVLSGRRGLGSLFVWASGNGGLRNDNCNCDGYTNSIYTLSVGSTTENGQVPWYNEACASILTTTYSSGGKGQKQIVTTDLRHTCTNKHTGTSASAPLAAGMIALALEANPALTWRDVYHLVVRASKPANLQTDDWAVNGVGRKVSHYYGYGLLDAGHLVDLAKKWTMIRPQKICSVKMVYKPLAIGQKLSVSKNISSICFGKERHIHSLEHVQAQLTLTYSRRGDLVISLTSPRRTKSTLVALRPHDTSKEGYKAWSFMSTHFWDEDPQGIWTLLLENKGDAYNTGSLKGFVLKLYGTDEDMTARPAAASIRVECMHRSLDGKCMECSGTAYAFEHGCLSYCPPRYYGHVVSSHALRAIRACAPCHPSCYTCQGGAENNCTACSNFSLYDQRSHVCLPQPSRLHHKTNRTFSVAKHPIVLAMLGLFCGGPVLLCLFYGLQRLATSQKKKVGSRVEPRSSGLELMCLNAVGPGELLR